MKVEFTIKIENEVGGVAIEAPCVGNLEVRARASAVRLADDAADRGQHAVVSRCQRRWHRNRWVDGRSEVVYDTAAPPSVCAAATVEGAFAALNAAPDRPRSLSHGLLGVARHPA